MWPDCKTDVLGDFASIQINRDIYSDLAVFKTAYWFTDRFYVYIGSSAPQQLDIELRSKSADQAVDLQASLAEFCNSLIDFSVREIVSKETGSIREALVTHAFTEGIPKTAAEAPRPNEDRSDVKS